MGSGASASRANTSRSVSQPKPTENGTDKVEADQTTAAENEIEVEEETVVKSVGMPKVAYQSQLYTYKILEHVIVPHLNSLKNVLEVNLTYLQFVGAVTGMEIPVSKLCQFLDQMVDLGVIEAYIKHWKELFPMDHMDPKVWTIMSLVRLLLWNGSDKSVKLCEKLVECNFPEMVCEELLDIRLLCTVSVGEANGSMDEDQQITKILFKAMKNMHAIQDDATAKLKSREFDVIQGLLGTMHNMVRHCECRDQFRQNRALEILQHYREAEHQMIQCLAELLLAFVVTDEENSLINSDDRTIKYLVKILELAMETPQHIAQLSGMYLSAEETVDAINKLAVSDGNKGKLVEAGVLPHLVALLAESCSTEEQVQAARGLWILSFQKETKQAIRQVTGSLEALRKLSNSSDHHVKKAATGALWKLEDMKINMNGERMTSGFGKRSAVPHIMISYSWANKPVVLNIKDKLRKAGYSIWMDEEKMSGSTLQAMALAVEQAAVVLICMSEKYKESPSCQTEAEYTYEKRKPFVPIKLQRGYKPDGWLGIMVGSKLYIDFSKDGQFDIRMEKLIHELGSRGHPTGKPSVVSTAEARGQVASWTVAQVANWFDEKGLGGDKKKFKACDGQLLVEYAEMMRAAPEAYYNMLLSKVKLDHTKVLQFTHCLRNLRC